MKILKQTLLILMLCLTTSLIQAQSNEALIGIWEARYEEDGEVGYVTYEFTTNASGEVKAHGILIKDEAGNSESFKALAMDTIVLKDGKGTARYYFEHEGETYDIQAQLQLKDSKTLVVSYAAWGYSGSETWTCLD